MNTLAFDCETKGLDWWDPEQQAFLATWARADGEWHADLSDPWQVSVFRQALDNADVIVGQNLKFDAHMIRATLGFDPLEGKILHDTEIMSRVLHPEGQNKSRGGHGLKELATVYLRADAKGAEDAIKAMGKSIGLRTMKQTGAYFDVWRAYPEVMERYARDDARFTYDLYEHFSKELNGGNPIYDLEMKVFPILVRAEARGIATDQEACSRLKAQYTKERDTISEYLTGELGEAALVGEGSEAALIEGLLGIGVPLTEKTPTGQLATNKFALQPFEAEFPQIASLFEYRRLERFLSTYIGAVEGRDIVHTNFGQIGAWTGRMSARSPSMQNFPKRAGKEVRAVFVPRPGHSFVVCDYEGIELRLLAYYLGDQTFRDLVGNGTHDPHAWMAANIWGGEMTDYLKGSLKEDTHRLPAKNILFAITYGAGRRRVANMLRDAGMPSSLEDAGEIISKIKASLPGYYKLNRRIKRKIEDVGYVNTIMGRRSPVNKAKSYVGLNAILQGSAADIIKQALVNVDEVVSPFGGVPLLVVHDEIVVEVPMENADACLAYMKQAMITAYYLHPPLAVSGSITSTSYADA